MLESTVPGLGLGQCQASFCESGVDGHVAFVNQVVAALKRFAIPLAAGCAAALVLQLVYACNVRSARLHIIDQKRRWKEYIVHRRAPDAGGEGEQQKGPGGGGSVPPQRATMVKRFSSVLGV